MKSTKTLFRLLVSGALTASMLLPSSLAVYQAKVKADSLYLRSAPGGSVIATLSQGTTVAVTNNSSEWYKVIVDGKEGYVSGSYLTGTTATDFSVGSGKITCSSTVNLRSEANTSSSILASLSNGTAVTITGVSGGWYKVSVNGKTGYVHPDYVQVNGGSSASTGTTASAPAAAAGKVSCSSTVNLRAEANTSSNILASLANGTAVTLGAKENGWYKVSVNGKSGYIKADYITTSVSSSANMASYSGLSAKRTAVLDYAAKFLGAYYDTKIYENDPFQHLDVNGVGKLVEMACKLGRQTNPGLELGICGEHGGDPSSIAFCHKVGLDYVSCSPFRVPIARLAAAQAAIREEQ